MAPSVVPQSSAGGAALQASSTDDQLTIEMLGAGQEVGRSCCVLNYKGKTIVCDTGVHPAFTGIAALPFIDELDWSTVDAILITHFHLDHAAALTYIMEKTNFKDGHGKVYMTHPTKAVYRFLMSDFVRISNAGNDDNLFDENEMLASWRQIEAVDFHQDVSIAGGLRFTAYHAGHVLGACMFLIEIAGLRILYTGDFSREEDRHLVQAEIPPVKPDVLICESTYGTQTLEPRLDKEHRFTSQIHHIVKRGGRVLLPVFVLGRAQELLLLLDEYWAAHPELHSVPIYYASALAKKCISIYQTYIHTMNDHIRTRFNHRDNPFVFKHISNLRSLEKFEDRGPCVMMASPGFMQSGVSRELLERWAPDKRNGLIVSGYSVEGTMARNILNEPDEIIGMNGQRSHAACRSTTFPFLPTSTLPKIRASSTRSKLSTLCSFTESRTTCPSSVPHCKRASPHVARTSRFTRRATANRSRFSSVLSALPRPSAPSLPSHPRKARSWMACSSARTLPTPFSIPKT